MTGAGRNSGGSRPGPGRRGGLRRLVRSRLGATAVEFALVAPIFLTMVVGVFELSRAMWIKATMQFAVEETTRFAMVNTSAATTTLETYAQNVLTGTGMSATGITFSATQDATGSVNYVTISASHNFAVITGLVPLPDVTLQAKSRVPLN